ncbi:C6 transcription factor [Fusarium phyllophilum]|uniref:C6 transcription factor n=1 Tax=Fusarium phyllophilum TaxID=47803 RepID=A0A8H5K4E8_9HYPO|nr:C6 transcription factor [Fusarium phyllophilum]
MPQRESSDVSSAGSPPAPKRRRRRPARSCEQCRRRKIRCNLGQPCNGCVRARAPMQCSYRDGSPVAVIRTSEVCTSVPAAQTERQGADTGTQLSREAHYRSPATQPENSDRIVSNSHSYLPKTTPAPQTSTPIQSSTSIPPFTPRLRHVPEKTKLFGQTHWLHTAEKFPVSGNFHPVEIEPSWEDAKSDFYDALKEARILRFGLKKQNFPILDQPIQDLRETLPSKVVCNELIACYLRTFEPLYRIVHIPSFQREYDRIWAGEETQPVSAISLVRLTLILALGTTFANFDTEEEMNQLWRLAQTWVQNAQWWLTGPNEKTTYNLDGLQIFCLLIIARQSTFNCRGATSWLSSGSLLRAAITMGLHRDPKLFAGLTLFQREFRARLWATVLELAVQSCLDLGLPLQLSEQDFDASIPSNYDDSELESASPGAPKPMDRFTDSYLQIMLSKSLPLRVEVIGLLNDFRQEKTYEKALALGSQLRTACRDVAAFFHSTQHNPMSMRKGSSIEANEFHRKLLDIHLRRFVMFLHRDFMLQARTDPRFYLSRKVCVESALVIASGSKGADFSLPMQVWDDFSRLSFVGRGLFKCALSFDAMLILALEIITELQDESTPTHEPDILSEMAKATRAPMINTLEEIYVQLRCMIVRGNLSLKRLLFSNAHLAHIRALEAGRPVKPAVHEAVTSTLRDCVAMLKDIQAVTTPHESVITSDSLSSDFLGAGIFSNSNLIEWDISDLLGFPTASKDGQSQWPVVREQHL